MSAYEECYLNDSMHNLAAMMDYAVNDCGYDADMFFLQFAQSQIGKAYGIGHPRYVAGQSGIETAMDVIYEFTQEYPMAEPNNCLERSPEYWAGWSYAYYQWHRGCSFEQLYRCGLTMSSVIDKYILHEADITKFVDWADVLIEREMADEGTRLRRLRAYWELTQKGLSEKSGVSLRMIQLYEQGQNDLSKAQAGVVRKLADALHCPAEELCIF